MPKTEDGQFELTLGNRQLLSVFFIVVILLGVFFVMGYIVGKNSTPVATETASTAKPPGRPIVVDSPAGGSAVPVPVGVPPATKVPEPIRTEPAKPEAVKVETKREPEPAKADKKTEKKAEPKAEAKTETKKEAPKPVVRSSSGPAAGQSYLQLAATSKREADVMIDVLKQKGFSATAAEVPGKEGTFRVLVGPIPEGGTNKLRADLQGAGFPGNAAIRRAF